VALRDLAARAIGKLRGELGMPRPFESFTHDETERTRLSAAASSDCARMFFKQQGRVVHKWVHYLDIYERHFAVYRNTSVKMLEIGIFEGGSLDLWRRYFGMDATICGIDINPECASRVTLPNQVRIGSQADPQFLRAVIDEVGAPDIVLDDGSHIAHHQRISFDTLFPLLRVGGLYVIEDLHTSYVPGIYEGGYRRRGTAIEYVKEMVDDMHIWYHKKKPRTPTQQMIGAVHFYDSLVVIEKRSIERPGHIKVGG
jgi:hypothetical protein